MWKYSADRKYACCALTFISATVLAAWAPGALQAFEVANDETAFPIVIDGIQTEREEWSDVDALAFFAPEKGPVLQTPPGHRATNCLFAGVAQVPMIRVPHLFLRFVFLSRTSAAPGTQDRVGEIVFPYYTANRLVPVARLLMMTSDLAPRVMLGLDINDDGVSDGDPADFGILAAASFGSSPLSNDPHLMLEVQLPISPEPGPRRGGERPDGVPPDIEITSIVVDDDRKVVRNGPEVILFISPEFSVESRSDAKTLSVDEGFRRGDSNADGAVDISDASFTLGCLFQGTACPACFDAADTNDDSSVDISDAVFTLNWLFAGGPPPSSPGPNTCGPDPSDPGLLGICEYDC